MRALPRLPARSALVAATSLAHFALLVGVVGTARAEAPVESLAPPAAPPLAPRQLSVPSAPDLSAFVGKPVSTVELVVPSTSLVPDPPTMKLRPHAEEPFSAELARQSLEETLATGMFGDAWVNAVDDGGRVRVRVHAKLRVLVESLRVEARSGVVGTDEVLREGLLEEGVEISSDDLDTRAARMRALLARRGYPDATVTFTTRQTDQPTRVVLLVDVDAHAPRVIERRVFYTFGAREDETAQLAERYSVSRGDRADESAMETADDELAQTLRTHGYHEATVLHDVVRASGIVTLRVRIDSGPRYVLRFEGNDHYDDDALRAAALGDTADADLSPQRIEARLKRFYEARGFYDAVVTTETVGEAQDRTRALTFRIREGSVVRVVKRSYPCVKEEDLSGLSGGGPSSAAAIGREIDSFLQEELPGADVLVAPTSRGSEEILSGPTGTRRLPLDLDPAHVLSPGTYERAVEHVQELYRNEGYLSALVGPIQVLRRTCEAQSPAGSCVPIERRTLPPVACAYDAVGLPLAATQPPEEFTCVPDARRGIACSRDVTLRIPVELGPRTRVYDLAFRGSGAIDDKRLARTAALRLGEPVNVNEIDEARRRLLDLYREEGFAYAEVTFALERSADHTRARVRFDVVEGERVIVRQIVVRGNTLTSESVIRRRIALVAGQPFRASDARKTQERIATLNVFSSVNVSLSNPLVPQRDKTVIVTVTEVRPQYIEIRPGFSTGEGARGAFEYGHKNLFGSAVGASVRAQLSYLPDFFILDPAIAANFKTLSAAERLAARVTATLALPEVGLGPLVRATVDGIVLQDPERYFTILKQAVVPSLYYRPARQVQLSLSVSGEHNNLRVFNDKTPAEAIKESGGNYDVAKLLRAPSGDSVVASQRFTTSWDRRDSAFNAHRGTYLAGSVEHADAITSQEGADGHFLRLAQTFSAYYPVTSKVTFAASLRLGEILQLASNSVTYPDRFFFMGGFDSMRGWAQDTMFPQDAIDAIVRSQSTAKPIDPGTIAVRGGNLMFNPRAELRLPLFGSVETVLFVDAGNVWQDARYPFQRGLKLRADAGTGVRVQTPIGPLALDYGINLTRYTAYEDFGALSFSIGLF